MNQPEAEATPVLERSETAAAAGGDADANALIVPVPVPAHLQQPTPSAPASAGPEQERQSARKSEPSHEDQDVATPGLIRRLLRAISPRRRRPPARPQAPDLREPHAARSGTLIALLDLVLRALNRPFAFLSPGARQVVGLAAIVTLAISAVTTALAPLLPRNDPVTFVRQKRAELDRPVPPPVPEKPEKAEEAASEEGGHGSEH